MFVDGDGKQLTTRIVTDRQSQLDAAKAKMPIEIEYDPQNPHYARWPGTQLNPAGDVGCYFTAALAILGAFLSMFGVHRSRADRRLYRTGAARRGQLDGVDPFVHNNVTNYRIDYSYDADGERVCAAWTARRVAEPRVGPIWIIVDSDDLYRSVPVLGA
jgi:hypothetical protein